MPVSSILPISEILGLLSDTTGLSLYVHNTPGLDSPLFSFCTDLELYK